MGICSSCESTSVATAKLILEDGRLQEFPNPVRVSRVLERNPKIFICNANDMEYDDFILAINGDEMLQIGQLYFELPVSWLNRRLRANEMAALAVKANLALKMSGYDHHRGQWCRLRKVDPVEFGGERVEEAGPMGGNHSGSGGGAVVKRRGRGDTINGSSKKIRSSVTKLDAILEEERDAENLWSHDYST